MSLKPYVLNKSQGSAIPSLGKVEEGVSQAKGPLPANSLVSRTPPRGGNF